MKLSAYKYQPLNILDLISSLLIAIFCLFLKATVYSINHLKLMICHHFSKAVIIKVWFPEQQKSPRKLLEIQTLTPSQTALETQREECPII